MEPVKPTSSPKQHDYLWFPDGNLVLSTNTYVFRVHKGVLSLQSTVFRDMFMLPTPEGPNFEAKELNGTEAEQHDGIPVVVLADDGRDIEHLLKAVYEPRYDIGHILSSSQNLNISSYSKLL